MSEILLGRMSHALKRALDVVISALALAVLAIPFAVIAVAIKLESAGPVFYRGERIGIGGRPFRIFKFRSMYVHETPDLTSTSADDRRVTRVGHYIRRTKIDELAQLINVLLGDMSLVGPRPEVRKFVEMYSDEEKSILSVRPGITDWSSIKFRNEGEIIAASGYGDADQAYCELIRPEKLRLQLAYVRQRSMWMDLKILWQTFAAVVRGRSSESEAGAQGAELRKAAFPAQDDGARRAHP